MSPARRTPGQEREWRAARELRAAARALVKIEEEHALPNWGGWAAWLHEVPAEAQAVLRLRAALGMPVPAELVPLVEALGR